MRVKSLVAMWACFASVGCHYDWPLEGDASTQGGGGASGSTCEGIFFCHDFDDGSIDPPWDRSYIDDGASVLLEPIADAAPATAPYALSTSTEATSEYAYIARNFRTSGTLPPTLTTPISRGTLSFAVRADQLDPAAPACLAGIVFDDDGDNRHSVRLLFGSTAAKLEEVIDGTSTNLPLASGLELGKWSVVTLAVEVGGRIVVEIDGEKVLDAAAAPTWQASDSIRIVLGINFVEGTAVGSSSFFFDDARFQVM